MTRLEDVEVYRQFREVFIAEDIPLPASVVGFVRILASLGLAVIEMAVDGDER